jgi:hypothetical protein
MGTKKIDKQLNYSHGLAQTKQQVGQCIIEAFLMHGRVTNKHKLARPTTVPNLGEANTFPLILYSVLKHGTNIQMSFCPRTPKLESRNFENWDSRDFGDP